MKIIMLFFFLFIHTFLFSARLPFDFFSQIDKYFGEPSNNTYYKGIKFQYSNNDKSTVRTAQRGYLREIVVFQNDNYKALKIEFDSGETVLYGNLYDFSSKINNYISNKEYDVFRDNFVIKIPDKSFKITHNEVIGFFSNRYNDYLYFELSDSGGTYINPLKYFDINFSFSPVIEKIIFRPYSHSSKINESNEDKILHLIKTAEDRDTVYYSISNDEQLFLNGKFIFEIIAYSVSEKLIRNNIISSMKIYVNDDLVYDYNYEKIDELPPSNLLYNPILSTGKYSYSFITENKVNDIQKYFDTSEYLKGENIIKIIVSVLNGKNGVAEFNYINYDVLNPKINVNDTIIYNNIDFSVNDINGNIFKEADIYYSANYYIPEWQLHETIKLNTNNFKYSFKFDDYKYNRIIIKVLLRDIYNRETSLLLPLLDVVNYDNYNIKPAPPEFNIVRNNYHDSLELLLITKNILYGNPELFILNNNEIAKKTEMKYIDCNSYNYVITSDMLENGYYKIKIFLKNYTGTEISYLYDVNINFAKKKFENIINSSDKKAVLKIPVDAIADNIIHYIVEPVAKKKLPDGMFYASLPYKIYPEQIYYLKEFTLSLRNSLNYDEHTERIGLYYFNEILQKWELLQSRNEDIWFTSKVAYNGIFSLLLDDLAPEIIGFGPVGYIDNNKAQVYIKFIETGSGLDVDKTKLVINNREVIFRYNKKNDLIYFEPNFYWRKDEVNTINILLIDKSGNSTNKKFDFVFRT